MPLTIWRLFGVGIELIRLVRASFVFASEIASFISPGGTKDGSVQSAVAGVVARAVWLEAQPVPAARSESINEESLHGIRKDFNQARRFREDIRALRAKGIQVIALIMVGLDGDTPDTFGRTLQFLLENKVSFLKLFTPCPYPGTPFYDELQAEGRILDGNWARYDYGSPLVQPRHMTTDQMMDGFKYVYEGFFSIRGILKRFSPPPRGQLLESLAYVVANLKVNRYLKSHADAWATIS